MLGFALVLQAFEKALAKLLIVLREANNEL